MEYNKHITGRQRSEKGCSMCRRILPAMLMCMILTMALSSCSGDRASGNIDLPQTLDISTELPADYPKEVTSYNLTWYSVDEQSAIKAFMREEPQERLIDAIGIQLSAETSEGFEHLGLHTGVVHGGLNYSRYGSADMEQEIIHYLRKQQPWESVRTDLTPRELGNENMEEAAAEDLDFLPYEDALNEIERKMDSCAFPEYKLLLGEAHSESLLNKNRDIYNNAAKERGKELISDEFTKDDEYYYFVFRQVQDGIPFCNTSWPQYAIGEGGIPNITAVYTRDGLISFYGYSFCDVGSAISTEPVISPEEAVSVYAKEYGKAIHFKSTDIVDIELNYVIIVDSKGMYARPAWVLTTATKMDPGDIENLDFTYTNYEVTAISAYSGVILERETDMR